MSVSGISSSTLMQYNTQSVQSRAQQLRQEFQQLGQDLQSASLSSAQQDYTKIQQDFGSHAAHKHGHGHHLGGAYRGTSEMSQLFQQLGQALQSGNVSTAQTAYSAMQQEFEQLSAGNGLLATQALSQSSSNGVSLKA